MKQSDENAPEAGDVKVVQRVKEHGAAVERALPSLSGPDIRQVSSPVSPLINVRRNRVPFLAAAAAAVLVVGGVAAIRLAGSSSDTQLEVAPSASAATETTVSEATETTEVEATDPPQAEADAESDPAELGAEIDLMPRPVAPADFATPEVRFLPPSDSGWTVAAGSRLLLSEGNLEPAVAAPERTQRVAIPTVDPADRRAILLQLSTYADEAEADAVIEAEPTQHGYAGEQADIGGRVGFWHEEEGFAPYSAGNPMRIIRTLRLRLDETTLLDVAAPDVDRADIEALVASLSFAEDGSLQAPVPPSGFAPIEPIDGLSPGAVINDPSASDYLSLSLVGVNGEQTELTISAESTGLSSAGAHFEEADGYGWIEVGLFGEVVVSVIRPDVTLVLRNYDGQVSAEELVDLALSIEPVDDDAWVERLAIAPLFDAPIFPSPIEE